MTKRHRELIDFYVSISTKARFEGLLALENSIPTYPSNLARLGVQLIVDCYESKHIEFIIDNCIAQEQVPSYWITSENKKLGQLEKTAILAIQKGENPKVLERLLLSFFGSTEVLQDMGIEPIIPQLVSFSKISQLSDKIVQQFVRDFDTKILALAVRKDEEEIYKKIIKNMSKNAVKMLNEDIKYLEDDEEASIQAKIKIGERVQQLIDSDDLVFEFESDLG